MLSVSGFDPEEPSVSLGHEPRNGVSALFLRLLELPDAVVMDHALDRLGLFSGMGLRHGIAADLARHFGQNLAVADQAKKSSSATQ